MVFVATQEQNEFCDKVVRDLLETVNNDLLFFKQVITRNEWIYVSDFEIKVRSSRWMLSPAYEAWQSQSNVKAMLMCLHDHEGVCYHESTLPCKKFIWKQKEVLLHRSSSLTERCNKKKRLQLWVSGDRQLHITMCLPIQILCRFLWHNITQVSQLISVPICLHPSDFSQS